jgi:hypothetical protein
MYDNREYLIFPSNQLSSVDFNEVLETSEDTVRKSMDGTKTFIKWEGQDPACISLLTNTEGPYTHSQIISTLSGSAWTDQTNPA